MLDENSYSTSSQREESNEEANPALENKNPQSDICELSTSVGEPPTETSFQEYEEFLANFWSKITKRAEPVKEKGWFEKYILEDVKKCYTPSATTSYYQFHRRVESCDDPSDNSGNSDDNSQGSAGCVETSGNSDDTEKCSKIFCPRLFCYNRHPKTLICCLAKLLTAAFQIIAIGAAFYYLHKWWVLRSEYKAIIIPYSSTPQAAEVGAVQSSGSSIGNFVRRLARCGFLSLIIVLPIALAIYYRLACSFYQYVYTKTYEEVREAQNDRILLENDLMRTQNDPRSENTVYDEIGDTKRQIMLGEIERISQYLLEAKNEILTLMDEKDRLKIELRHAIEEKNEAKKTFDSAVKYIVREETIRPKDEDECTCAMIPMPNQCSLPKKYTRSTSMF